MYQAILFLPLVGAIFAGVLGPLTGPRPAEVITTTLVLITALNDPVGQVLSDQLVATELVRSAVGTIGLIAAVPLTTALAAWWGVRRPGRGAAASGAAPGGGQDALEGKPSVFESAAVTAVTPRVKSALTSVQR